MAAPSITILFNNSQNNSTNTGGASGDANWKVLNTVNDRIAFMGDGINNDDANTSKDVFLIPESGNQEPPRTFVNDYSEGKWKRVWFAGSNADQGGGGNYRYAFGAYVDGTTASVPVLQAWDSTSHDTYNFEVLGSGSPANSMLRAVATTNSSPGDSWAGTPLAGNGASYSVELDTGAIIASKMLYWNMRLLVPSTANPFSTGAVLSIYFTYS